MSCYPLQLFKVIFLTILTIVNSYLRSVTDIVWDELRDMVTVTNDTMGYQVRREWNGHEGE